MYILFQLPQVAGREAAHYVHWQIQKNLKEWSRQYQVQYKSKTEKLHVKVTFDDDKLYDFFALTWQPKSDALESYVTNYSFVEPMNRV